MLIATFVYISVLTHLDKFT